MYQPNCFRVGQIFNPFRQTAVVKFCQMQTFATFCQRQEHLDYDQKINLLKHSKDGLVNLAGELIHRYFPLTVCDIWDMTNPLPQTSGVTSLSPFSFNIYRKFQEVKVCHHQRGLLLTRVLPQNACLT